MNLKPSVLSVNVAVSVARSLAVAGLAAWPSVAVARALRAHPLGDAVLFEPGGIWLLDVAHRASIAAGDPRLAVASWLLGSLVLASFALASMMVVRSATVPSTWNELGARAWRMLGRFTLLSAGIFLVEVVVVALWSMLVGFAFRPLVRASDAHGPFVVGACLGVFTALVAHVLGDLARLGIANEGLGVGDALSNAWARFWAAPMFLLSAAFARMAAALVALGLASVAAVALAPTKPWLAWSLATVSSAIPVFARSAWFGVLGRFRSSPGS